MGEEPGGVNGGRVEDRRLLDALLWRATVT